MSSPAWNRIQLLAICLAGWQLASAAGQDSLYEREVKPLLRARCYACHGALKQEATLRLDTGEAIRRGGESGPIINSKHVEASLLLERVAATDPQLRMPPEGEPITPAELKSLRAWIAAGATSPAGEQPERDPNDHWAFRPLQRPSIPPVSPTAGDVANPIDAFLLSAIEAAGAAPASPAPRSLLLRRASLDLVGVPPSPAELHAFLDDTSPHAYSRAVERLLNDRRHGERWARHWMDVWRYSDWYGRRHVPDVWNGAPQVWRWRDWIVDSLNEDKGYDRMVHEMLAADELAGDDPRATVATGYLVRNWYALNPNDWMRNTVEHTGKAFLGLTFNCAHCHDHKYDPITQDEYFGLRAFFEPMYVRQDRVAGEADPGPFQDYDYGKLRKIQRLGAVAVFDKTPDAPTWFYAGGDERNRAAQRGSIPPATPAFLSPPLPPIEPISLPPAAWYPGLQPGIQRTLRDEARRACDAATEKLTTLRQSSPAADSAVLQRLADAEQKYEQATEAARREGRGAALAGRQSLVLRAGAGRRIVQNRLLTLRQLPEESWIEFQVQLLSDTHFNFQLAKDADKGLTAAYVGFVGGRIVSYRPGGFAEFDAGSYRFADGQRRFHVRLTLQPSRSQGLLTVTCHPDGKRLVDQAPVAVNDWRSAGDQGGQNDRAKSISFDARAGSAAAVDDWKLSAPAAAGGSPETLVAFDFEPPACVDGQDVLGVAGWEGSSFGQAPGASQITSVVDDSQLTELAAERDAARRAARLPLSALQAAEAELAAAEAEQQCLEARIDADRAQHGSPPADAHASAAIAAIAATAVKLERESNRLRLAANVAVAEHALAVAEAKPADDKDRAKDVQAAEKQRAATQAALAQERTANPPSGATYTPLSRVYPQTSTGRRAALALWITDRRNPLAARVAVNHIWTRHFHQPLVSSVFDFGRNGAAPTHPELLDWLAVELIESGWSMKHLHRLIVSSAAYQRHSTAPPEHPGVVHDPLNATLWRMPTGRMEAEVIRDSLLHVGDMLDPLQGGPPLENTQALTTRRRSLYYEVFPEVGGASPLSQLFDAPNPLECYRRTRSVVPQQALALTNSDLVHTVSASLIAAWQREHPDGDDAALINDLFERLLSRPPTAAEEQVCAESLAAQRALPPVAGGDPQTAAREGLARALLNHNDFVTIR
ncbi:MAG: DUF1553 domain-containing protein [Planctomycetales bacterium]|nr:DUF1553 domain-containing protein [Planctomycetales bacterium]